MSDGTNKTDLDVVLRNLRTGNYLPEQLPPAIVALIGRVKELEATARELGEMSRMGYREDVYESREKFMARRAELADIVAKGVMIP